MNITGTLSIIGIITALLFSSKQPSPPTRHLLPDEQNVEIAQSLQTAFTPGNVVVCRVGDGIAPLGTNAAPVFLDEYSPTGMIVSSTALPTAVSGTNRQLTLSGNLHNECQLGRSADGRYFVVAGYAANPGTLTVSTTQATTVPRVIGRVDMNGTIDTSTTTTSFNLQPIRSATSDTGAGFWATGQTSGVVYQTLAGSGAGTAVAATPPINSAIDISGGQLFTAAGGPVAIATVGSGLPTTAGQFITPLTGTPGAGQPNQFFFADLDSSVAGNDTLYVADFGTATGPSGGGVKKYSLQSGSWVYTGTFPVNAGANILATQFMGLNGTVIGTTAILYATRVSSSNTTQLVKLTDANGYGAAPTQQPALLATPVTNTAFRGVAIVPTPTNPGSLQLSSNAYNGAENNPSIPITVTRSNGSLGAVAVSYTLSGGTATGGTSCTAGVDYINNGGVVNFAPSDTAPKTINVALCNDTVYEGNETFNVTVANPIGGATLGTPNSATVTIADDELPPLSIQFSGGTGGYENAPTMQFFVTRTGTLSGDIGATITFGGGTATKGTNGCSPGVDYYTTQTTVSIPSGQNSTSYTVNICDDNVYEGDETFTATLSGPTGGAILGSPTTMTFLINENEPTPLSGTVNVGVGQTYPTLDSLFRALNQLGIKGDLDVNIVTDITNEPGSLTGLVPPTEYLGSGYTITIRPSGGMRTVSGATSPGTPLIFVQSPRVHIDCSGPSGSRSLLFRNTTVSQNTLSVTGDGVAVENCIFEAGYLVTGTQLEFPVVTLGGSNQPLLFSGNLVRERTDVLVAPGTLVSVIGPANVINNDLEHYTIRGVMLAANGQNIVVSGNRLTGSGGNSSIGINSSAKGVNSITNNQISASDGVGIKLDMNQLGQGGNTTAEGNRVFNARNGISANCKPGAAFKISNNFVTSVNSLANNTSGTGIELRQIDGCAATVDYNTVYLRGDRTGSGDTFAFYADSINAGMNLNFRNNIFFNGQTGGPGVRAAAYVFNPDGTTVSDNNFFAGTGTSNAAEFMQETLGGWVTLAAWQAALPGRDVHSLAGFASSFDISTIFVDSANGDLHLKPTAGAILNAGTAIAGITTDIDGDTRSATTPDIGADEIQGSTTPTPTPTPTPVPGSPIVVSTGAVPVRAGSANPVSVINPNGNDTNAHFRYSTANPGTCNDVFGSRTPDISYGSGTSDVTHFAFLNGLTPTTTYYYCVIAANSAATVFGSVESFTTPTVSVPSITSQAPTNVTGTSATLNGAANPNAADTSAWFRYSPADPGTCNDTFGTRAPATGGVDLGSGTDLVPFSQAVSGLSPSTTYYVCVFAQNSVGLTGAGTSSARAFTTAAVTPTPTPTPTVTPTPTPTPSGSRVITFVGGTAQANGGQVTTRVRIAAQGDENGVGFSLNYDPALLGNPVVTPGSAFPNAALFVNANTTGKVGIVFAEPTNATIPTGDQELVTVTFDTISTSAPNTPVTFGDVPVVREVSNANADALPATFVDGLVTFAQGYESDVVTRPTGSGSVTVADVTQVGRFSAGLDTFNSAYNEFQRADSAPRSSLGNGAVTVADYTQAGRYAAGLDGLTYAGGPSAPGIAVANFLSLPSISKGILAPAATTSVQVVSTQAGPGSQVTVSITANAQGTENGFGFTLDYDPTVLQNPVISKGADAQAATLFPNTLASGKAGVILAYPVGTTIPAGTKEIITITFDAAPIPYGVTTPLTFSSTPVVQEVSDVLANTIETAFTGGTVTILGPTAAGAVLSGRVVTTSGVGIANAIVTVESSSLPAAIYARTNSFGHYSLPDLPAGRTYLVTVASKRYRFAQPSRVVNLVDSLGNFDFVALPSP